MSQRWVITVCDECGAQLANGWTQHQIFPDAGKGVIHRGVSKIAVVPAAHLAGAVEALREVRAELVAPSGHPVVSAAWCARAIERIDAALGGQQAMPR
jgi:hypothetical protein